LVGCAFIGPRIGRFHDTKDGKMSYHIPGHSTPLTCLGGFILITGFLGMALGHGSNIELSSTNMIIGGAISGLTAMLAKAFGFYLLTIWMVKYPFTCIS